MKESKREFLRTDFGSLNIDLNTLDEGTDKYRAVMDAVSFAGERQVLFWAMIGSSYIDGSFNFTQASSILDKEIKTRLEVESDSYREIFNPLNKWFSRSFSDNGIVTGGQRFRFVCDSLEKDWLKVVNHNRFPVVRQVGKEKV